MISKNITKYREKRGFSKRELARRTGLTARGIEFIEHEITINPRIETLKKIAKALNVSVEDLLK